MINGKKIVSLIPLRGGSKSIPYKNIKAIAGQPLCYWVLKAAARSKYIDEVWVSTDDKKIKDVVRSLGLGVRVIDRPAEFATDNASTESVMLHFAEHVGFDILNLIQATSPLTTSEDLDKALEKFEAGNFDSLVSGVLLKRFFWTPDGTPLNYDPHRRPRRQEFEGTIMENGAFYLTKRTVLEQYRNRLGGKIGVFQMPDKTGLEIDESADWSLAEKHLLNQLKVSKS